jgi:hypothetical protein
MTHFSPYNVQICLSCFLPRTGALLGYLNEQDAHVKAESRDSHQSHHDNQAQTTKEMRKWIRIRKKTGNGVLVSLPKPKFMPSHPGRPASETPTLLKRSASAEDQFGGRYPMFRPSPREQAGVE